MAYPGQQWQQHHQSHNNQGGGGYGGGGYGGPPQPWQSQPPQDWQPQQPGYGPYSGGGPTMAHNQGNYPGPQYNQQGYIQPGV